MYLGGGGGSVILFNIELFYVITGIRDQIYLTLIQN